MTSSAPKSEPLRILYWRSEILRVVYWLFGEGLGDVVDMDLIREYLGVEPGEDISTYVDLLVADGSLVRDGEWFALSARGMAEGEAQLATAFTDLIHPVFNDCNDECWCRTSPAEAEACAGGQRRAAPDYEAGKAPA
ncbi:MAG TPA: hypothetical protein VMZ73_06310 [Acidimicrobiales bacterium]|nr:hypothetical protein [Acidimicrobiales bacterium]